MKIGDRVKIRKDSEYYGQGFVNSSGEGIIKEINEGKYTSYIQVEWSNNYINIYPLGDLELVEKEKFKVGDNVWVKTFIFSNEKRGGKIIEVYPAECYLVKLNADLDQTGETEVCYKSRLELIEQEEKSVKNKPETVKEKITVSERYTGDQSPLFEFSVVKDESRVFDTGMKRDNDADKPYVHNLQGYTRLRFGYLTRMGAIKYGDGNFLKGSPSEDALKSLDRHLAKYLDGDRSEDHIASIIFNAQLVMLNDKKEGIPADHYFKSTKS